MDAKKFGDTYRSQPAYNYEDPDPKRAAVLEEAREWSQTYSTLLLNYLQGAELSMSEAIAHQNNYTSWIQHSFSQKMREVVPALDDPDYFRFGNELNFHIMNMNMRNMWIPVLTGDTSIPRHEVQKSQNFLALSGVEYMDKRTKSLAREDFYVKANGKYQTRALSPGAMMNIGVTTEIDTAISLLEITKKYPHIAILPAPGQFEHSRNNTINSDFIGIDLIEKQVRGFQTKSMVGPKDIDRYDSSLVTLIDGSRDLDNTLGIRKPGSSDLQATPWPGLISAHHLLMQKDIHRHVSGPGQKGKNIDLGSAHLMFVKAKQRARELTNGSRSSNSRAAAYITQRVLADLYS
ncbi:MAG: hypothetical protein ABJA64_01475 [Candidatus Saccharibacteria bacterium]